jgi:hypothetical protein
MLPFPTHTSSDHEPCALHANPTSCLSDEQLSQKHAHAGTLSLALHIKHASYQYVAGPAPSPHRRAAKKELSISSTDASVAHNVCELLAFLLTKSIGPYSSKHDRMQRRGCRSVYEGIHGCNNCSPHSPTPARTLRPHQSPFCNQTCNILHTLRFHSLRYIGVHATKGITHVSLYSHRPLLPTDPPPLTDPTPTDLLPSP